MNRIKIIDVPRFETDPKVIVEQLTEFLKRFRKYKLAVDLIGNDDRSVEFDFGNFDDFADELSEGDEISYRDTRRITARANKLAKDRVAAAGVSHLKREEYDRLEPSLEGMQVIMAKDQNWADEVAAKLHADMPWMARATEYAWHALRRSAQRGEPVLIRPVILNGPPGIGKSVWARSLATALATPYADVDATKGGAGMALVGVDNSRIKALVQGYAGKAGLDVALSDDVVNRLIYGSRYRFGRCVVCILEAIECALMDDADALAVQHFEDAWAQREGCDVNDNVFSAVEWQAIELADEGEEIEMRTIVRTKAKRKKVS